MSNEQWFHDRLASPLFASLAQMVEVGVAAIGADAGAGRVFQAPTAMGYVTTGRLGVPREYEPIVHDWPLQPSSAFARLRGHSGAQGVFRPLEVLAPAEPGDRSSPPFGPIVARGRVVDALAVEVPTDVGPWALLIFFRCDTSDAFISEQSARLEALREPLSGALRRGAQSRPVAPTTAPPPRSAFTVPTAPPAQRRPAGARAGDGAELGAEAGSALVERLSATERRVLGYLCARYTERQVAETLGRSPHTIHVHVKNIYRKLAIGSRKELLQLFDGHVESIESVEPQPPREAVAAETTEPAPSGDE